MSDKTRKASADKINLVSNRDAEAEELHEVIDRGAFTLRRQAAGQETALLVEFASGRCRGFSYSYFMDAGLDEDGRVLVVNFAHCALRVTGRNLHEVLNGICRYRVSTIREELERYDEGDEAEAFISRVEVVERGAE